MKFRKTLSVSLAAICAAALISALQATAYADSSETVYPDNFVKTLTLTDSGINDFAISGDNYAFSSGTNVYLIYTDESDDRKLETVNYGSTVTALDYSDGKLYCKKNDGVYVFPNSDSSVQYDGFAASKIVEIDSDTYILTGSGKLTYYYNNYEDSADIDGTFTILKEFDDVAYAVKDNAVYKLDGAETEALDLSYTDFALADNICTGIAATALKADGYEVKVAKLASGSYCTEIEDDLSGTYFKQIKTIKTDNENSVLILAESGNASAIVLNNALYITKTDNLTADNYSAPTDDIYKNGTGYILQTAGVYSSPYICAATKIDELESTYSDNGETKRTSVSVKEKFSLSFIDEEFYKVSYTSADGTEKTGYVAAGFLSVSSFSAENNETEQVKNSEFDYDTNVTTVILVLAIVGLVIIAIVYLTLVGTKKTPKAEKKRSRRDSSDEE